METVIFIGILLWRVTFFALVVGGLFALIGWLGHRPPPPRY